jgi:peptide/nickel transport system substrate-binding protein
MRQLPDVRYFAFVGDSRHHVQAGLTGWLADSLTPSNFFGPSFTCGQLVRRSGANNNLSQFCDPAVDAGYDAALSARGTDANARWAAVDRLVLAAAPAIPLYNARTLILLSDRVGHAQMNLQLGPLLDQFWVR